MKIFDHMINEGIFEYFCNPWGHAPDPEYFSEMDGHKGQVQHGAHIFIVHRIAARSGGRFMDDGAPECLMIYRIRDVWKKS